MYAFTPLQLCKALFGCCTIPKSSYLYENAIHNSFKPRVKKNWCPFKRQIESSSGGFPIMVFEGKNKIEIQAFIRLIRYTGVSNFRRLKFHLCKCIMAKLSIVFSTLEARDGRIGSHLRQSNFNTWSEWVKEALFSYKRSDDHKTSFFFLVDRWHFLTFTRYFLDKDLWMGIYSNYALSAISYFHFPFKQISP